MGTTRRQPHNPTPALPFALFPCSNATIHTTGKCKNTDLLTSQMGPAFAVRGAAGLHEPEALAADHAQKHGPTRPGRPPAAQQPEGLSSPEIRATLHQHRTSRLCSSAGTAAVVAACSRSSAQGGVGSRMGLGEGCGWAGRGTSTGAYRSTGMLLPYVVCMDVEGWRPVRCFRMRCSGRKNVGGSRGAARGAAAAVRQVQQPQGEDHWPCFQVRI